MYKFKSHPEEGGGRCETQRHICHPVVWGLTLIHAHIKVSVSVTVYLLKFRHKLQDILKDILKRYTKRYTKKGKIAPEYNPLIVLIDVWSVLWVNFYKGCPVF